MNELYARHNLRHPSAAGDAELPIHRHWLRHDASRFWVAEIDGRVVGFGAGIGARPLVVSLGAVRAAGGPRNGRRSSAARACQGRMPGPWRRRGDDHRRRPAVVEHALRTLRSAAAASRDLLHGTTHFPRATRRAVLGHGDRPSVDRLARRSEPYRRGRGGTRSNSPTTSTFCRGTAADAAGCYGVTGRPVGYVFIDPTGAIGPAASLRPADMTLLMSYTLLAKLAEHEPETVRGLCAGPRSRRRSGTSVAGRARVREPIGPAPHVETVWPLRQVRRGKLWVDVQRAVLAVLPGKLVTAVERGVLPALETCPVR